MKEYPILFNGPMVQATLDDRKTQTRRTRGLEYINAEPDIWHSPTLVHNNTWQFEHGDVRKEAWGTTLVKCPYGPGDRLWVKESHYRWGTWIKNGLTKKTQKQKWRFAPLAPNLNDVFFNDNLPDYIRNVLRPNTYRKEGWYKRSPLFMPKKFARLWLEVVSVRFERVQDISLEDIRKEGLSFPAEMDGSIMRTEFKQLWDSINGKRPGCSWVNNLWVWVVEFRRIEP